MNNNTTAFLRKKPWTSAIALWAIILLLLLANGVDPFGLIVWILIVPYTVLIVLIHYFYLIPFSPNQKFWSKKYLYNLLPVLLTLSLIIALLIKTFWPTGTEIFPAFIFTFCYSLFVAVPIAWYVYKNDNDKIFLLSQLGKSQANLTLLRSQINPHFLFNTLNSLYGTALQENAEKTSEGIQKLGDMMRFMLYENNQNAISLAREINYLKNYIDLQKLRIANSPQIAIDTQIDESFDNLQIAPMLLIPFVENAFKHGISFNEPSFIKINLQILNNRLLYSVNNSVHPKNQSDPEKEVGGIGLENVKQRLGLLYPGKHELVIRENHKEYFVHLTLTL